MLSRAFTFGLDIAKHDRTQSYLLTPTIKNNSQLASLGFGSGTIGLNVEWNAGDTVHGADGEIAIAGQLGEYARLTIGDAMTSYVSNFYVNARGR
ncbi:MAG: hypothetical protein ABSF77_16645 [Spirochaetia bacterium]